MEQWRIITKEKKAAVVVLDMPLLDTRAETYLGGVKFRTVKVYGNDIRSHIKPAAIKEAFIKSVSKG